MKHDLLALTVLSRYEKLFVDQLGMPIEQYEKAIKQLKDLEHFSHYTSGLWCTDRPDLLDEDDKEELFWKIDFWDNKL